MSVLSPLVVLQAILLLGSVLVASAPAQLVPADTGRAQGARREVRNQLGASINNAGLQDTLEVSWQRPLTTSTHPLRAGAHWAVGAVNVLTPSMNRLGGWLQIAPLSVVSLRVGAEPAAYFGTFHSVLSFRGYGDLFDQDTRKARGKGETATGLRAYVTPAVQVRAGAMAVRATADIEWWRSSVGGPLYYEPARDTLLRSGGDWLVNATIVALYQRDGAAGGFTAGGLLHNLMQVADAPDNRIQRLGLMGIHEFASPRFGLPHLRLTAAAWRYLDDPSKRNEWGAAVAVEFRVVAAARTRLGQAVRPAVTSESPATAW